MEFFFNLQYFRKYFQQLTTEEDDVKKNKNLKNNMNLNFGIDINLNTR